MKTLILSLAPVIALAALAVSGHAQSATATISAVSAGGGNYDYTIVLDNTGAYSLNSFWYGWTQDGNNLPSDPSSAGNSLGWNNDLDGNSIQWENSSGPALAPDDSATFTFVSSATPTEITTPASGESVAYVGGIDFSQDSLGDSTDVFSPTLVVLEPSFPALAAIGAIVAAGSIRLFAAPRQR